MRLSLRRVSFSSYDRAVRLNHLGISLLLSLFSLSVTGCREINIPPAGSYSEVLLVTEEGATDPLARAMVPHLETKLDFFISEETQFKITHVRASAFEALPPFKNIIICGAADPLTDVGRTIVTSLGQTAVDRARDGTANIFKKDDLPGPGQLTIVVTGESNSAVIDVLERRGAEVNATLEGSCRERLRRYLLTDKKANITKRFSRTYGFKVEIPVLYRLLSEELDPPGIELLRDGPTRLLGVFWVDWDHTLTLGDSEQLYKTREAYVAERYDGDTMDASRVQYTATNLSGYPAIRMNGYWSNTKTVAGGYYESYFVYEEAEGLLWVVDLLIFAPGLPKHPLMRELLAVAETFRYE